MGNHSDKLGDYDSVLVIPSLSFVADEGFSLAKKEGVDVNGWNGAVVGVLGRHHVGKRFLMWHLSGSPPSAVSSPSSSATETKTSWNPSMSSRSFEKIMTTVVGGPCVPMGMAIKFMPHEQSKHLLIKQEGFNAAIDMNDYVEKERATREREKLPEKSAAVGGHSKIFAERKQSGLFVQDLILELSDIIIVVVGDMGLEDQEYLFAILRERERVPKLLKEVLVVHNLAHINNKLETVEAFERGTERLFPGTPSTTPKGLRYFMSSFQGNTRHVYLVNQNNRWGSKHNARVLDLLRYWIKSLFVPVPYSQEGGMRMDRSFLAFGQAAAKVVPKFFENSCGVHFTGKKTRPSVLVRIDKRWNIQAKSIEESSRLGGGSPRTTTKYTPRYRFGGEEENFVIQIECPGIPDAKGVISTEPIAKMTTPSTWGLRVQGKVGSPEKDIFKGVEGIDTFDYGNWELLLDVPHVYPFVVDADMTVKDGIVTILFPRKRNWNARPSRAIPVSPTLASDTLTRRDSVTIRQASNPTLRDSLLTTSTSTTPKGTPPSSPKYQPSTTTTTTTTTTPEPSKDSPSVLPSSSGDTPPTQSEEEFPFIPFTKFGRS